MRRSSAAALSMVVGMVLVGCSGTGQGAGTATRSQTSASSSSDGYGTPSSYMEETQPTTTTSEADGEPVIQVAGPTLDDAFPADRGRFFEPEQRCAWLSNPNPIPVTIEHVAIVDQQPSPSFELGPTSQELCAGSESGFIVDRDSAHYGSTCDGVELAPSTTAADPEAKDDSCAVMVAFNGTSGTNWSADLRLDLSTVCTDPGSEPCDQLEITPTPDQPVIASWVQVFFLGACLVAPDDFPVWPECRLDQSGGAETTADTEPTTTGG